jgi:hypothetical protein
MNRPWKEVAKRADQRTYAAEEVRDSVTYALARDWKNEVSAPLIAALKKVFTGQDNSLGLTEIALDQLERAKPLAGGSVFGANAVAWCVQLVNESRLDNDAFYEAIGLAARERGFAASRQFDEHYLRKVGHTRADGVGGRVVDALKSLSDTQLGAALIDPRSRPRRRFKRRSEVDEGVPL